MICESSILFASLIVYCITLHLNFKEYPSLKYNLFHKYYTMNVGIGFETKEWTISSVNSTPHLSNGNQLEEECKSIILIAAYFIWLNVFNTAKTLKNASINLTLTPFCSTNPTQPNELRVNLYLPHQLKSPWSANSKWKDLPASWAQIDTFSCTKYITGCCQALVIDKQLSISVNSSILSECHRLNANIKNAPDFCVWVLRKGIEVGSSYYISVLGNEIL